MSRKSVRFRHATKWLLSPIMLKIRSGPLEGRKWKASSGIRFVRGTYEPGNVAAIQKTVKPDDVAYDVGAHVGYFSVLMGDIVGSGGKVVAFEPRGLNLAYLQRHVSVNHCDNIEIVSKALGDRSGHAKLETRTGSGTGYVSETGDEDVEITSIDELVASGTLPPPTFLKIDVEGGEMAVLRGARKVIEEHRPRMILATHGDEIDAECRALLSEWDYDLQDIDHQSGAREMIVTPRA
ncbi:MAG: FkbM family methyltransferase [Woeseia sp.]